jgi:hypothetical protein
MPWSSSVRGPCVETTKAPHDMHARLHPPELTDAGIRTEDANAPPAHPWREAV